MVDWDRVEELRSKGWDWERIAKDPKVAFHADSTVREPGRALRSLYHRQKLRERRQGPVVEKKPTKREVEERERRWTLRRIGYLFTPIFGLWCLIAYLAPSPVGLVLPAIPYLALALAVAAFLLIYSLWRSQGARWSKVFRSTVTTGIVLGLLISAMIAVGGVLFFGCPYLPPAATGTSQPGPGWVSYSVAPWQEGGLPIVYFYGASWCPYCSASSWAIWAALSQFSSGHKASPSSTTLVPGAYTDYSSPTDVNPSTPEMVLAYASVSSPTVAFQVSEDTSGVEGTFPGTADCVQQAYVTAYSGGAIPFLVVNGQYVHGGSTIINPSDLSTWAGGANGGATTVATDVASENPSAGSAWLVVQTQAWWIMAFAAKASGQSVGTLAVQYGWSATTESSVASDEAAIH